MFAATEFRAFQADAVKGIRVAGRGRRCRARRSTSSSTGPSSSAPAAWCGCGSVEGGALDAPVAKFLSEAEQLGLVDALGAAPGDLLLLVARDRAGSSTTCSARCASSSADRRCTRAGCSSSGSSTSRCSRRIGDDGRPIPAHHPFTMPHPDDVELLEHGTGEELLAVRSQAYDLVLNGWELGSGSVRIHRPDMQQRIFSLLGIAPEEAQARFGFLLDAFRYGAPPHAGFAFGIDRLAAILARRGEHPRGHRLPEDPVGRRPAHRRARPRSTPPSSRSSASAWPPRPQEVTELASPTRQLTLQRRKLRANAPEPCEVMGGCGGRPGPRMRLAPVESAGRGRLDRGEGGTVVAGTTALGDAGVRSRRRVGSAEADRGVAAHVDAAEHPAGLRGAVGGRPRVVGVVVTGRHAAQREAAVGGRGDGGEGAAVAEHPDGRGHRRRGRWAPRP